MADESETLEFLQEKGDIFVKLSTVERKRQAELEDAIAHIHAETSKYRSMAKDAAVDVMNVHVQTPHPAYKRADGNDVGRQAIQVTKKVLNGLEANLNKLLQHQSEIMNANKQKKLEINHLRRMRIQTEMAQTKYENQLYEIKTRIENTIQESTDIVAERERQVKEKDILERVNEEEQKLFTQQHEAMSDFIKQQNNALEDALMKERKFDKNPSNSTELLSIEDGVKTKGDLTLEDEIDMARQVGRLTDFVHNEQNSLSNIQERVYSYEIMFDQLKKMTGSNNLEDVLISYVNHEEEMFSLYNFISTMNNDIDRLHEAKNEIRKDMRNFEKQQYELEQQQGKAIGVLSEKYQNTVNFINLLEETNRSNHEQLNQINKKISSLFFKLQCDQSEGRNNNNISSSSSSSAIAINNSHGSNNNNTNNNDDKKITNHSINNTTTTTTTNNHNSSNNNNNSRSTDNNRIGYLMSQGVNENNVLEYLGCIEQRAVDIIAAYIRMTANMTPATVTGNNTGGTTANRRKNSLSNRRFSSLGGLTTPASFSHPHNPVINIDDVNNLIGSINNSNYGNGCDIIDDYNDTSNGINHNNNHNNNNNYSSNNTNTANYDYGNTTTTNNNNINDSKPIDLSLYKEKLLKKMSFMSNNNNGNTINSWNNNLNASGNNNSNTTNNSNNNSNNGNNNSITSSVNFSQSLPLLSSHQMPKKMK